MPFPDRERERYDPSSCARGAWEGSAWQDPVGTRLVGMLRLQKLCQRSHRVLSQCKFLFVKTWIIWLRIYASQSAFAALPAFLPTIIADIGFGSVRSQGLSAPPYLVSYLTCLGASTLSDRLGQRAHLLSGLSVVGAVGYLVEALVTTSGVRYFGCFLICGGVFPSVALAFTWETDNQGSASKRAAGLVIFGMIGQVGSIAGSRFFPKEEGPYYTKGMSISAGLLLFAAFLTQILRSFMWMENRRRNKVHGFASHEKMPPDVADAGDDHPEFRYIL